jgi:hydrogenase/urease accessory protein HupE
MNNFAFYFDLGWEHIISRDALDHQLFIIALGAIYLLKDWKQVLILVTAFTVGHSLTLALASLNIISLPGVWVEFLIPLTIVITGAINLFQKKITPRANRLHYLLALFFGLIHGLGFANTIRFMLSKAENIFMPLLGFNLGLEAGQILVITGLLLLSYALVNKIKLPHSVWINTWSVLCLVVAGYICIERWPFSS